MPTPKEKEKLRSKRLANKAAATAKKGKKDKMTMTKKVVKKKPKPVKKY